MEVPTSVDVSLNRWKPITHQQYFLELHELGLRAGSEGWEQPLLRIHDVGENGDWAMVVYSVEPIADPKPEDAYQSRYIPELLSLHYEYDSSGSETPPKIILFRAI